MEAIQPRRFGWRWLIIIRRVAAAWAAFILVAPVHLLLTLLGLRSFIPPRFLRLVSWLIGMRVRVEGRPVRGRVLLLANHVSWMDILALAGASGAAFVAQGGLTKFRFLKWLCKQNQTLFVERERRGSVARQVEQLRAALIDRRVAIFPEGTTSDGKALLPFKSALLAAAEGMDAFGVRVQPVALEYRRAAAIAWHDGETGKDNVLRILARRRPIELTVRFLAPLSGSALGDRKAIAELARSAIARSLAL